MKINLLTLKYAAANEIIKKFIDNDPTNTEVLKCYFKTNALKYQHVYATLFPKYSYRIDEYGLKRKAEFDCLINKKYEPVFDFTVLLVETFPENVEIITKTNKFLKLEDKKEIRKKKKRTEKKETFARSFCE